MKTREFGIKTMSNHKYVTYALSLFSKEYLAEKSKLIEKRLDDLQ